MTQHLLVVGEALVEIMRPHLGIPLAVTGPFQGPFPSGAPAIAADAAARAGAAVSLIAAIGNDPFGRLLTTRLSAGGVNTTGMRILDDAVTGVAFVSYDQTGQREFIFHVADAAPSKLHPSDLGTFPERATWIHVSGSSLALSDQLAATVLEAVERVLASGGSLSFDPNLRKGSAGASVALPGAERLLEAATLILPSVGELEALGTSAVALAHRGALICETDGRHGARLYQGSDVTLIPGIPAREIDPTGAGDVFSGIFLATFMSTADPLRAAHAANTAAAAHVTTMGPMPPSPS
jgi:sugar/nucleoside kinase (ribokinase family)